MTDELDLQSVKLELSDQPNKSDLGPAEIYLTERNNECVVYKGFRFYLHRVMPDARKRWKCVKYQAPTYCKSKLITDAEGNVLSVGEHIGRDGKLHHSSANIGLKLKIKNCLKAKATTTMMNPAKIIDAAIVELGANASQLMPYIPNRSSLSRLIGRQRAKFRGPKIEDDEPDEPKTLADIEIPEELQVTEGGENFLLFDSASENGLEDKDRWILFGTISGLERLANSQVWFVDGTFSSVPALFAQLITVYGLQGHEPLPLLYILIPSRTQEMYVTVFDKIKTLLGGTYTPMAILADFDAVLFCALQVVYPYPTKHLGSIYHFEHVLLRDITTTGIHQQFNEDVEVQFKLKKLASLAFLRADLVEEAFNRLAQTFGPELDTYMAHFEQTWVGCSNFRGRKLADFPIHLWNFHSTLLDQLPITNEAVASTEVSGLVWHSRMLKKLGPKQAKLVPFIKALIAEQATGGAKLAKGKSFTEKILEVMTQFDIAAFNMVDFATVDRYLSQIAALMLNVQG